MGEGQREAGSGVSSSILDSREEPHLVSHAEVSLSLFALHTRIGFLRSGRGREEEGVGDRSPGRTAWSLHQLPSPTPNKAPALGPGYVTCPALPAPRSLHHPLGAPCVDPAPRDARSGCPDQLNPPHSLC